MTVICFKLMFTVYIAILSIVSISLHAFSPLCYLYFPLCFVLSLITFVFLFHFYYFSPYIILHFNFYIFIDIIIQLMTLFFEPRTFFLGRYNIINSCFERLTAKYIPTPAIKKATPSVF
ncbi:hypothetical protein ACJX0J_006575 [Zea mays]